MKKLFSIVLALCLLCSFALAEETPELSWEDSLSKNPDLAVNGSDQMVTIDGIGNILYWVPGSLAAVDVDLIEADTKPVAAFGAENGENAYSMSVFALALSEGLEGYISAQQEAGADIGSIRLITTNGLQIIGMENPIADMDMILLPISDSMILLFAFTPLNGDEEWDEVKAYIASSIRLAE